METCNVQVISREIIKPSSQTPHYLKTQKLSYLDQLSPATYIPLLFFYNPDELKGLTTSNHVQISQHLKHSLSKTLTSFYPLAGSIQDNSLVDCNDSGCQYIEARAHQTRLMDVMKDPNMESLLKKFIPVDPISGDGTLVSIQITFFDCGGIAIAVSMCHKVADFSSEIAFISAWAANACGGIKSENSRVISFDLANYFPTRDFPSSDMFSSLMSKMFDTKRLLFDKEKLAALKQAATSPSESVVKDPTSVEVVSAFIWKHFIECAKAKNTGVKKTFAATQGVNLRPRTSPPHLLDNVFGNCIMVPNAFSKNDKPELHNLVSEFRSAIRTVTGEYITKAQSGDNYLNDLYSMWPQLMSGELEWCGFSSWCRFPVYEVDFGWGNPVWFCTTALPFNNSVILIDSKSGDGIEAWLKMPQDTIQVLQTQMELKVTRSSLMD